jgi:hypothetical protein
MFFCRRKQIVASEIVIGGICLMQTFIKILISALAFQLAAMVSPAENKWYCS